MRRLRGMSPGVLVVSVARGLRACGCPGRRGGVSSLGRVRGQRPGRAGSSSAFRSAAPRPVPGDRGVRAGGDHGQRVAQDRTRPPRRGRITSCGGLDDGEEAAELAGGLLDELSGPGAQAVQPSVTGDCRRARSAPNRHSAPARACHMQRHLRHDPIRERPSGSRCGRDLDTKRQLIAASRRDCPPANQPPPEGRLQAGGSPGWCWRANSAIFWAIAGAWSSWGKCLPGIVCTFESPAAARAFSP